MFKEVFLNMNYGRSFDKGEKRARKLLEGKSQAQSDQLLKYDSGKMC